MKELFEQFPTLLGLAGTHEMYGLSGVTVTDKKNYVKTFYPSAKIAGEKFGLNPIVILAQGSLESAWGTSYMAKNIFNFFGITAAGKPNEYWKGDYYVSKSSGLKFRKYANAIACFSDFARLITTKYVAATKASHSVADYAREISNSPYAEQDPVSRENYRKGVISNGAFILNEIGLSQQADKAIAEGKNQTPTKLPTAPTDNTRVSPPETETAGMGGMVGIALASLLVFGLATSTKKSKK